MPSLCLYFQVHQPFRLKPYDCFKIGYEHVYEDEVKNREILDRVSKKCYLTANHTLLRLIEKHKGKFKIAYSISGTALEQFERYQTGCTSLFSGSCQNRMRGIPVGDILPFTQLPLFKRRIYPSGRKT